MAGTIPRGGTASPTHRGGSARRPGLLGRIAVSGERSAARMAVDCALHGLAARRAGDWAGLARVTRSVSTPIMADQSAWTAPDVQRLSDTRCK